ncbi:MAG: T9SS type A sorting domain-containing protein [Bacteroidia bacterium]
MRRQWQNNSAYTLPKYKERVAWDFTNDGTIDLWDVHTPEHVYLDPGTYECALWSMDSLGQWQKLVKTVEVPGAKVNISLADESQRYVCAPDTVIFKIRANLYYDQIDKIEFFGRTFYYRDSFDIHMPITNNYKYSNTIKSITKTGCLSSYQNTDLITILGPRANFTRVTDPEICLGHEMVYKSTGDTGNYKWFINEQLQSNKPELIYTAQEPDYYNNIQLQVTQSITFPENLDTKNCISYAFVDSLIQKATLVNSTRSNRFEIKERLDSNKVTFVMQKPDPYFNTFNYFINNSDHNELFINDSLFTIAFDKAGSYTVCTYLNDEMCADTFCQTIWVDALSTNEIAANKIELYPNPTSGNINLVLQTESSTYRLIDLTGREIQNGNLSDGTNEISLENIPNGVYLIEVELENAIVKKRLIKN